MKNANNGARVRGAGPRTMLRDEMAAIREDLSSLVAGRVGAAERGARRMAREIGDTGMEIVDAGKRRASALHKRLGDAAGAHPVTTIVVAAAIGAIGVKVLGRMWRR